MFFDCSNFPLYICFALIVEYEFDILLQLFEVDPVVSCNGLTTELVSVDLTDTIIETFKFLFEFYLCFLLNLLDLLLNGDVQVTEEPLQLFPLVLLEEGPC